MTHRVLFVAWDGPHQNYLESLFFPIFAPLAARGFAFSALQLRDAPPDQIARARRAAQARGIPYEHVATHTHPKGIATLYSIAKSTAAIRRTVREQGIDILMPRSTIPAAIALALRTSVDCRLVFDADGFAPDERVDFAGWAPTSLTYRLYRDVEAQMVRRADAVITRTSHAKQILLARAGAGTGEDKIHVIANAKDETRFCPGSAEGRAARRAELELAPDAPLILYAGTLGPQYFVDSMFDLFVRIGERRPDARMIVLSGQRQLAVRHARARGVDLRRLDVRHVAADDVAPIMACADLGIAFRAATYSQRGVSPIKVGEYLLCGLPVLATSGVGDLDVQLGDLRGGRLLEAVGPEAIAAAAAWFIDEVLPERDALRQDCRARGVEVFGLRACVERYAQALRTAIDQNGS